MSGSSGACSRSPLAPSRSAMRSTLPTVRATFSGFLKCSVGATADNPSFAHVFYFFFGESGLYAGRMRARKKQISAEVWCRRCAVPPVGRSDRGGVSRYTEQISWSLAEIRRRSREKRRRTGDASASNGVLPGRRPAGQYPSFWRRSFSWRLTKGRRSRQHSRRACAGCQSPLSPARPRSPLRQSACDLAIEAIQRG